MKSSGRGRVVIRFAGGSALAQQALEAVGVQFVRLDPKHVAGSSGQEELAGSSPRPLGLECLAQLPHVDLKGVGGGRRGLRPQLLDQPIAGNELVRTDQQDREQGSLLRCAQRHLRPFMAHFERPEDLELHCSSPAAKLPPASTQAAPLAAFQRDFRASPHAAPTATEPKEAA